MRVPRRRLILTAFLLACLGTQPAPAQVPGPPQLRAIIGSVAADLSRTQGVLVDPRLLDEMTASLVIFAGNFCFPPDRREAIAACNATVTDRPMMTRTVGTYLEELVTSRPAKLVSVGARLARSLNLDFSRLGFPDDVPNYAAVLLLGDELRGSSIAVRSATGPVALGTAGRAVVLAPGRAVLVVQRPGAPPVDVPVSLDPRSSAPLRLGGPGALSVSGMGRVDTPVGSFCYGTGVPTRFSNAAEMFNWGRATRVEPEAERRRNLAPFAQQTAIDIRVVDETGGSCGPDCQEALAATFAQAIGAWRGGCERCTPNALSVVRVGSTLWVDERIANRLRRRRADPGVPLDLAEYRGDDRPLMPAPSASVPRTFLAAYEDVSDDRPIRDAICALPGDAAPWARGAQSLACPSSPATYSGLRPTLRVLPGPTKCGVTRRYLACGLPGGDVEVTTAGYQYLIPGPRGPVRLPASFPVAGVQPINAFHVVLHEVGHWFGVPHPDEVELDGQADIMASVMGSGPACLSGQAMLLMNNASDLRWRYRITAGGGLQPPPGWPVTSNR